ncbi:MAG: response regulator, partial [Moorea sp. SIO3C2]|nr:response regulator [Moorena sp. SIO3C2]
DVVSVAKALYPYILQGIVHLTEPDSVFETTLSTSSSHRPLSSTQEPKVVCIDDGITFRQSVELILKEHGYQVFTLGNPLEALGQVFLIRPDLILCDITMPELDGYEVCAMLRKSKAFRQIPIVMLTGKDGFIDRIKARMVGANDYLTKPFSGLELLTLVERYVGPGLSSDNHASGQDSSQLANLIAMD